MENKTQNLPLAELKKQLDGCFEANPIIYWIDFLASAATGYATFIIADNAPLFSLSQILSFIISVFALYRAALFIHELTHQERKDLPGFSLAWNLIIGIPLLIPSLMYRGVHLDHHKKNSYATAEDGEYLPFGASPFFKTLLYIAQSFYLPIALVLRYGVLGPLSLTHPKFRIFVMKHASSFAIRFDTARKIPAGKDLQHWYVQEFLCFLYVLGMFWLFSTKILPLYTLQHIYFQMLTMFLVNSIRTVVAHRYMHKEQKELNFQEQLADSINLEGNAILAELVAPVGLRYHGLHHLFPTIPYHNLGIAHRKLLSILPPGSFYHNTIEPNLWSALLHHWKRTQEVAETNSGSSPA